jgi:hypothetical protein
MGPKQFDIQIFDEKEEIVDYFEDNSKDVLEQMYDYVLKNIKWEFAQRERKSWMRKAVSRWSNKNKTKVDKDVLHSKTVNN